MKFTLGWLKRHLATEADPATIAQTLTRIGLEVEGFGDPAQALAPFRIATVLTAERHPQADKLQVLMVDAGDGPVRVVCGAPNARAGMKGVFGPPGAFVPGSGMTLKVASIRGVESAGMMCSARELGLGEDHQGIIELAADAPVGAGYAAWAGIDDPLFDVAITPNRPDCLGVDGIARDLAAAGLGELTGAALRVEPLAGDFPNPIEITVEQGSGCPLFGGRVIRGVVNGPSPDWLQQRLKAVGLRPISALVDITNYFSIDQARPLHVYDVAKLDGAVGARRGRAGESFVALNGREYFPTPQDIVIADQSGPIGLGGVMGGEATAVDQTTTEILLECAWFEPALVGATGRRHGIVSDARARFERGVDPASVGRALDSAAAMIVELAGGSASQPTIAATSDAARLEQRQVVAYRPQRLASLAGMTLDEPRQRAILQALGFVVAAGGGESWQVEAPSWRPDIDGEADLVEEIARIHGFDSIVVTALDRPDGVARPTATALQRLERRLRRAAAADGLDEAITWSFIAAGQAAPFGGEQWTLANPISEEMKVMRPSLIPGLAAAARRNTDRGATSIRLFEIGRRYLADGERPTLGLLLAGERDRRSWHSGRAEGFTAFDAKSETLALLEAAGAPVASLQLVPGAGDTWHPGRSALLTLGPKTVLAAFGELHPQLARELDAPAGCVASEIYLDALPMARSSGRVRSSFAPPALQPVRRDFAFVVPDDLAAGALVRAIRSVDRAVITDARLFDRFQTGAGELSLAVEVVLQPAEASFTEAEIAALSARIVTAVEKLGARLRG